MVKVISEKRQEFNGVPYYLCGFYFQNAGKRLHRIVYEHYYGEIPKGCVVHHKDGNTSNNQPDNLALLQKGKHTLHHLKDPGRKEKSQYAIKCAIAKAPEWHASPKGIEWHKQQYQKTKDKLHNIKTFHCSYCGKPFDAENRTYKKHFCSNACCAADRRKSGKDDETRNCAVCGKEFKANKYQKVKYCSDECRAKTPWGAGNKRHGGRKR